MRKKAYLAGLGTGFLIATVLLFTAYAITPKPVAEALSEDQIIEKAKRLGMTYPYEIEIGFWSQPPAQTQALVNAENEEIPLIAPAIPGSKKITVTILRGMTALQIARLLEEYGVVDDADRFTEYLTTENYTTKIMYGQFSFSENMSYEDLLTMFKQR